MIWRKLESASEGATQSSKLLSEWVIRRALCATLLQIMRLGIYVDERAVVAQYVSGSVISNDGRRRIAYGQTKT